MIEAALNNLIRGTGSELKAYLQEVSFDTKVQNTKAISHCYHILLDGNGRPRVEDFIEFIATKLVEYTIPRSEFEKAKQHLLKYSSESEFSKLRVKAESLFTDLSNTGEGGEILLYILVQEFLKIPQLLCKMPLKTNTQMHYHGVDGIHAEYDLVNDVLALYWGESKLYQNIEQGIKSCFESLKSYLLDTNNSSSSQERDLQLVKDGLDLNDEKLEDAIVQYFDKDNPNFNKLQYRGVCLVGYDCDKYPTSPNQMVTTLLTPLINAELTGWQNTLEIEIGKHTDLNTFIIHVFLVPFPSVEAFREYFLKTLHFTPRPVKKKKEGSSKTKKV